MTGPGELASLADEAKAYAESSRAEATLRGYRSDWADPLDSFFMRQT